MGWIWRKSAEAAKREGLGCRAQEQIIEWRGKPAMIRCDNGPEYISGALMAWAERAGIKLEYTQPGNPQQNAHIERYNRTMRYGWLAKTDPFAAPPANPSA